MMILNLRRLCSALALGPCALTAALAQSAPTSADAGSMWGALQQGWDGAHWRAVVSPWAPHIRPSDEHQHVWAVGVERQRSDRWLAGGSFFSNSFGQPSVYLYAGRRFDNLMGRPQLFGQLSAGLMYGYVGKYEKKVPFNHNGFSPGALASIGWQFNRQASFTVHAIGDAAVMFQFGWDLR